MLQPSYAAGTQRKHGECVNTEGAAPSSLHSLHVPSPPPHSSDKCQDDQTHSLVLYYSSRGVEQPVITAWLTILWPAGL